MVSGEIYMSKEGVEVFCVVESNQKTGIGYGYNLETEEFLKVKMKDIIPLPKSIKTVLKSEKVRYFIARGLTTQTKDIAPIMNIDERTAYRLAAKYDKP